ncbi:hypothetical protein DTO164E3_3695 [Paecilomyces variotii]|nr:hypothetical protein DTO164E3_3695 [Paecilomyces variotii]KAJ9356668.1 hypothetical protein DTO027B9_3522 [Paecilomyces variotii]
MTDTSSVVATTHSTTDPYPVAGPLNSPVPNGAVSDSVPPGEDEPYTIKCICAFQDDDGNTVFCERCETWQHIECYYHGRDVPEVHNCVDCEPRPIDAKRATERQRRLREQSEAGDRKSKRSGPKSHKKKSKDPEHVNGFHQRSESGVRDQPPTKKTKTSHRPSVSVSSLPGTAVLQPDSRKRSGSMAAMSPTKAPGPSIPLYSNEFLHLYQRDQEPIHMEGNLFVNLTLAADLASWVKDPSALSRVVNGRSPQDIFTRSDASLESSRWPHLSKETITDTNFEQDGLHPTWMVLKTDNEVRKDEIVGEVRGKIGLLRDYCLDPSNRWQELRHPEPFVFFHPQLPIYIDSREEGTMLRYIRRSCRPNVTMKTFITNEVEYRFCFVANQDIPPQSEITAMWYLDPQLFESTNGLVKQESNDGRQEAAAICISNVLAHFGGCACDSSSQPCLLSNVDLRRYPKAIDSSGKQANGRRKKAKSKPHLSPAATGRADSEGVKNQDDDDMADGRSTSGSTRGHARSRDETPTMQSPNDLGDTELSARDKRKIAAVEKKFEQLEHDQHTHQRKKKRSTHSAQTTPTVASSKQHGYFPSTTGRQSRSPPFHLSPGASSVGRIGSPRKSSGSNTPTRSPLAPRQYVDSAMQTDPDENDVRFVPPVSTPRRHSFVPLTQRLLKRCHQDRVKLEELGKQRDIATVPTTGTHYPSSPSVSVDDTASKAHSEKDDVEMRDADTAMTPPPKPRTSEAGDGVSRAESSSVSPSVSEETPKPPQPPWPSTAAHNSPILTNGARSALRVQLPPTNLPAAPFVNTPGSAVSSVLPSPSGLDSALSQAGLHTPGSGVTAPSPVKKKLSLGDYLSRRGITTPTTEKSQTTAMLPPQKSPSSQAPAGSSPPLSTEGAQTHPEPALKTDTPRRESPGPLDVPMKDVPKPPPSPPYVSSVPPTLPTQPSVSPS